MTSVNIRGFLEKDDIVLDNMIEQNAYTGIGIFENVESDVRSYCRKYTEIFSKAKDEFLFTENGDRYIDFLSMAGSMNFGHNNSEIKTDIMKYLSEDNIINALDMYTSAKKRFFECFLEKVLKPRGLDYKIMCCGPTGTNSVEAAIKLARKNTGRKNVIAFSGAFHGMSLGSLALTTDRVSRDGAGVSLGDVTFVPYGDVSYSLEYLNDILSDDHSGIDKPAAIILETTQAEGGVNVADNEWLREVRRLCDENDILMIIDDIQVGVGRTGWFFSFERAGIVPDMVVLSKSISGFGLPMALLLIRPELDIFKPAEHNGTFRGQQLSFVGAESAIRFYVSNDMSNEVRRKGAVVEDYIKKEILSIDSRIELRGIGLLWGLDFSKINSSLAIEVLKKCFEMKLIIEVAGRHDSVLKLMPPLIIKDDNLLEGLSIIKEAVSTCLQPLA